MKAEIYLFLKRSFPVSFEVVVVSKIELQNENVAFVPNPIPPPPPQKSIFRAEKTKVSWMSHPTLVIKCMNSKPVKFSHRRATGSEAICMLVSGLNWIEPVQTSVTDCDKPVAKLRGRQTFSLKPHNLWELCNAH